MRKIFVFGGFFISIFILGQEYPYKVGINTSKPRATLDIKETPIKYLPNIPQGVLFPTFSTEERAKFLNVKEGTMIFNSDTDKKCLEIYVENNWKCLNGITKKD